MSAEAGWLNSNGLEEALLDQLAADLGGPAPATALPVNDTSAAGDAAAAQALHRQYSVVGQTGLGQFSSLPMNLLHQASLPQPLMFPLGFSCDAQQLQNFGSAPDLNGLPNSLTSANNAPYGANGMLQPQVQPVMMFRPAFGTHGVMADARPAASKSHSPSNSSGAVQGGDDSTDLCEGGQRGNRQGVNKGALAQKRFRERQKEKMRASEAQVAELTRRLGQVEMEKARLASRARLLEQVVSLNMIHEAKLHTNREIMVREQEMLLEDLASFMLAMNTASQATSISSPNSPEWLQGTMAPHTHMQQQQQQQQQGLHGQDLMYLQQQQVDGQQMQQQEVMQFLQQQQQHAGGVGSLGDMSHSGQVASLMQVIRGWTVQTMLDQVFPHYIGCLQQLLPRIMNSSPVINSGSSNASAAAAQQAVEALVLQRREMTDRHALFSHYYWAVWCFNKGELAAQGLAPPTIQQWTQVMHSLNLSKEQTEAIVSARAGLLAELHRVAADWQRVLPTLALQLLQVPRAQWHTVGAVQAMVTNLAAEREAVVGFLHTLIDEVLTPVQEGQLEASSYPWCPDVWAIAGAAAAAAAQAAANASAEADAGGSAGRSKGGRKGAQAAAAAARKSDGRVVVQGAVDEDPMAALSMGTDVLQPLMPFMTAFQLLRAPITAKGAGLRLKRALLLDPFRTVVPAAAYPQPTAPEVANMSLLDAHCGTFQQVMLWDWLKANLPSYVTMLGMHSSSGTAAPAPTAATAASAFGQSAAAAFMPAGLLAMPQVVGMGLQHSMSAGNMAGAYLM